MSRDTGKAYPVILTAGDRGRARPVLGINKGLLDLAGAPVFTHVLATLEQSRCVERIYVVGPRASLEAALKQPGIPFQGGKPLRVLEQGESLYLNVWNSFQAICEDRGLGEMESLDTAVLVVPCDIPLLILEEVEEFVGSSEMERFDYVMGISSESTLSRYFPQHHRKGIRPMCFRLKEGSFRQNNLHLVKPARVKNRDYIQKVYDYRLQREWGSIMRLFWEIFRTEEGTVRIIVQYMLLHLASVFPFSRIPIGLLARERVEKSISTLLGARFTTAETRFGGAALDIDTPEHYGAIRENFETWIRAQRESLPSLENEPLVLASQSGV